MSPGVHSKALDGRKDTQLPRVEFDRRPIRVASQGSPGTFTPRKGDATMSAARAGGDTPATTANTNPSRILEGKRAQRSWFTAWLNADMMMILRPWTCWRKPRYTKPLVNAQAASSDFDNKDHFGLRSRAGRTKKNAHAQALAGSGSLAARACRASPFAQTQDDRPTVVARLPASVWSKRPSAPPPPSGVQTRGRHVRRTAGFTCTGAPTSPWQAWWPRGAWSFPPTA